MLVELKKGKFHAKEKKWQVKKEHIWHKIMEYLYSELEH